MYLLEDGQFEVLSMVKRRLYDCNILSPDARRDLANTMDAILYNVENYNKIEDDYELVKKEDSK